MVDQPVNTPEGDGVVHRQDPAGGKASKGSRVTSPSGASTPTHARPDDADADHADAATPTTPTTP